METIFNIIKREYEEYYRNMLRQGQLPVKDTGIGFWGPSITEEIFEVFKKLKLHKYESFIDLGAGDGKVVLIASLFCKKTVGIEFDPILLGKALEIKEKLKLNATFYHGDYFYHNISKYDIVFCYPDKPMYRGLEEKLLRELRGKFIHYGHHFYPSQLKKIKSFLINNTPISIYINPIIHKQRVNKNK